MPTLFDVMKRVADAKISHQDFSTEMSLYMGEVKTLESVLEYVEGEMVKEFGCESFENYLEEYEHCASPIDPATLNEKKIELAESVINAQQPQLSMLGIETAWRKNSQLHHGDPEFIVSMTDPINPYNDAGPAQPINIETITNEQLQAKVDYALKIRPNSPSALLVANGAHWSMIAIDPRSHEFKIIDSYGCDMSEDFRAEMRTVLPEYTELPFNAIKQQDDAVNCGIWVINNCQHIVDNHTIDAIFIAQDEAEYTQSIKGLREEVTSGLSDLSINQILESKSEPKLAPDVVANLAALEIKDIEPEDQNIEEKRVGIIVK